MKKNGILFILIALLGGLQCHKGVNDANKEEVITIVNEDNSIFLKISKRDVGNSQDNTRIGSIFTDNGIIVVFESSISLNSPAEVEIHYEGKSSIDSQEIKKAYLYQFNNSGHVESTQEIDVDGSKKIIAFKINRLASSFISFSAAIASCNNNPVEYAKYLALKRLQLFIQEIKNNYNQYSQNERCKILNTLYETLKIGAFLTEEYRFGSQLLDDWLTGKGKQNEPVQIPNEHFNDRNTTEDWNIIWQKEARKRADGAYNCISLTRGLQGNLDLKITGHGSSATIGVGSYDFYTQGSYSINCNSNVKASFTFNIGVQAQDKVDFNPNSSFKFDQIVCGERIEFTIPDQWGLYLRDNCGIGKDYIIQGKETFFPFGTNDYPDLICNECNTNPWEITSFPGNLYGNWYSDYDGSWQWGISGSTTIRTFNRFFSVHSTYGRAGAEYEYKVITTEGGRWHTFFFKNVTVSHMHATFPGCPSPPTGFDTENEALEAGSGYNQYCNGNHK